MDASYSMNVRLNELCDDKKAYKLSKQLISRPANYTIPESIKKVMGAKRVAIRSKSLPTFGFKRNNVAKKRRRSQMLSSQD